MGNRLSDALGYDPLNPLALPGLAAVAGMLRVSSVLDLVPAVRRVHLSVMRRAQKATLARMVVTTSADLSYHRE